MAEFHTTQMGREFFEGTMPRIADALEQLARGKPKSKVVGPDGGTLVINAYKEAFEELGISDSYPLASSGWCEELCIYIKQLKAESNEDRAKLLEVKAKGKTNG